MCVAIDILVNCVQWRKQNLQLSFLDRFLYNITANRYELWPNPVKEKYKIQKKNKQTKLNKKTKETLQFLWQIYESTFHCIILKIKCIISHFAWNKLFISTVVLLFISNLTNHLTYTTCTFSNFSVLMAMLDVSFLSERVVLRMLTTVTYISLLTNHVCANKDAPIKNMLHDAMRGLSLAAS